MNLSLGVENSGRGSPCSDVELADDIANVRDANIVPVISSGNDVDPDGIADPACAPGAVRVGAMYDANLGVQDWGDCVDSTTTADKVVCFSDAADFLTALAPGCEISVAGLAKCGTSQAAPHVAGTVALLRAPGAFATDSVDCTVSRIVKDGDAVIDPRNGLTFSRVNALGAATSRPNSIGDCNANGVVAMSELLRGVDIDLGHQPLSACPAFDADGDAQVSIDELVTGVNIALTGCSTGESGKP